MAITPSPFATPGNPPDVGDFVTADSVASGPAGIAEEIVKLWNAVIGTQLRVVADENNAITALSSWGGDLTGIGGAPVVAKIHGVPIDTPPGTTTVFLRGDGTWTAPDISVIAGVAVSGTPSAGQTLIATSATTAAWQTFGSTSGSYTTNYLTTY